MAIGPKPQKTSQVVNLNAMDEETRAWFDALPPEQQSLYIGYAGRPRPDMDSPGFNRQTYEKIYYKLTTHFEKLLFNFSQNLQKINDGYKANATS